MMRYRWWIGSLLLGSTIINYIDRQTLSVLAPILQEQRSPCSTAARRSARQWRRRDWFAVFLHMRGFRIEDTLSGFRVPFIAADAGNFFGGGVSSTLIARGWPVGRAREAMLVFGSAGVLALEPAAFLASFPALIACFAIATFCCVAASTMTLALPADLYRLRDVASLSGMCGTGAGIGTTLSTFVIGEIADRFSFGPILVVASMIPLGAAVLVMLLIRKPAADEAEVVNAI